MRRKYANRETSHMQEIIEKVEGEETTSHFFLQALKVQPLHPLTVPLGYSKLELENSEMDECGVIKSAHHSMRIQ